MKKRVSGLSIVFAAGILFTVSAKAEMPSGKMLADTCAGCHGFNGVSAGPAIPSIAGLAKTYFVDSMKEYKEGKRPSTIMGRIARGYSDDEIDAMADEFSRMRYTSARQEFSSKNARKGKKLHKKYCEKCHAEGGSDPDDEAGWLAGQWKPYLKYTMDDFLSGKRKMKKKMKEKVDKLVKKKGKKSIAKLIEYYASIK